jgi:hypothetical protein
MLQVISPVFVIILLMFMLVVDVVVGDTCKKSALQTRRQGVSRVATSVKAKVSGESCIRLLWMLLALK